jgi:hypothetical protein
MEFAYLLIITPVQAVEFLKLAKDVSSEEEREASLQRSLELFKNVAGIIPYNKLREICLDYRNLGFAVGGIQLALACARAIDPQNSGTSYFDEGKPTPDPREATYSLRCQCYSCVFDLLVDAKYLSESRKEIVDRRICRGDPIKYKESVFSQALASDDRVFHFELYEWFLREGMTQELLEVSTHVDLVYMPKIQRDLIGYLIFFSRSILLMLFLTSDPMDRSFPKSQAYYGSTIDEMDDMTKLLSASSSWPPPMLKSILTCVSNTYRLP